MTKKAFALADSLAQELTLRLAPLSVAVVVDTDTDLLPLVKVGPQTAGSQSALIKIVPQDFPLAKDILGLQATIFTPHKAQIVLEANQAGTADNIADFVSWPVKLPVLAAVVGLNTRVELYESATGNAVGPEDIISGNLKASFDHDPRYGMLSNQ
jgi:hypothetical protein